MWGLITLFVVCFFILDSALYIILLNVMCQRNYGPISFCTLKEQYISNVTKSDSGTCESLEEISWP